VHKAHPVNGDWPVRVQFFMTTGAKIALDGRLFYRPDEALFCVRNPPGQLGFVWAENWRFCI